jgi:hypothetical protein
MRYGATGRIGANLMLEFATGSNRALPYSNMHDLLGNIEYIELRAKAMWEGSLVGRAEPSSRGQPCQ